MTEFSISKIKPANKPLSVYKYSNTTNKKIVMNLNLIQTIAIEIMMAKVKKKKMITL